MRLNAKSKYGRFNNFSPPVLGNPNRRSIQVRAATLSDECNVNESVYGIIDGTRKYGNYKHLIFIPYTTLPYATDPLQGAVVPLCPPPKDLKTRRGHQC